MWTAADVIAGWLLFRICLARESAAWAKKTHLFTWDKSRAVKVAVIYLFNPLTISICAARSTTSFELVALLAAVNAAMSGSSTMLTFYWAASSLLSLYPVLLFPMLVQLCRRRAGELVYEREVARIGQSATDTEAKTARQLGFLVDRVRSAKRHMVFKCLVLMPTALAGGLWVSRAIALSPGNASIGSLLLNLPNVLSIPLDNGWAWTEQVYGLMFFATDLTPNLGLWWYFFMEIFDHFRDFFLLTFNIHLACYAGSANSNFFYAITLVWGLGGGMLVLDAMWAWGRERWESERTPIRTRAQHHRGAAVDADVSVETTTSETDVSAEKVLAEDDRPRRRIVVQV
ncbi:hypothetical protein NDA16_000957 [Ustilago loliicola]|nr:hypothetical protein NDA16_000957 [Ustilago loliicola]